jgi:hypothetical protein
MKRMFILLVAVVTLATWPASAQAAPGPITIWDHVTFSAPPTGTFETDNPGCPSGTSTDRVVARAGSHTIVRRYYVCTGVPGVVTIQYVVNELEVTARWTIVRATGAWATLSGHGTSTGTLTATGLESVSTGVVFLPR